MTNIPPPPAEPPVTTHRTHDTAGDVWRNSPLAWKLAALFGILGFVFKLGGSTTTTRNGSVDCDGLDVAPFVTAGLVVVLAVVGYRQLATVHPARRLASRTRWIVVGVLGALAVAHVVRGLIDPAGSFC